MLTRFKKILVIFAIPVYFADAPAQEFWYESYRKSQDAILRSDWENAILHLDKAVQLKPKPELNAETYAMITVDYLPYFWRGAAAYNLGEMEAALSNFSEAELRGVVQKSEFSVQFTAYSKLVKNFLNLRNAQDSLKSENSRLTFLHRQAEEKNRALQRGDEISARGDSLDAVDQKFDQAVDQFLAGNLPNALLAFEEIAREAPERRNVESWIRLISSEIRKTPPAARVDSLFVVRTDTLRTTAAPLLTAIFDSVTSAETVQLNGRAVDDLGVLEIEITVNGKPLDESFRRKAKLAPDAKDDARNFQFHFTTPLAAGANRIVMTARDADANQHRASYPIIIQRTPPFYQSRAFVVTTSGALFLIVFAAGLSAVIRRRIAFVNKFNPYIAGAPIRDSRLFFGREKLLNRILNTLDRNSILLYGPRRIGKTSFQHRLKDVLEQKSGDNMNYVPVMIDLQGASEERLFAFMMEEIANVVKSLAAASNLSLRFDQKKDGYTARDFNVDLGGLVAALKSKFSGKFKLILLIDEVDALNVFSERTNQRLRSIFMKTYAEHISAVMTGVGIRKNWESEGSPWYNFFEETPLQAFDKDEAAALIRKPVSGVYRFDEAAVERIIAASNCNPYLIQKICMHTIYFMCDQKRRRIGSKDIEKVINKLGMADSRT